MEIMFYTILVITWVILIYSLLKTKDLSDRSKERDAVEFWYGETFIVCGSLMFLLVFIVINK